MVAIDTQQNSSQTLAIMSLVVAALAVVFAPAVQWVLGRQQLIGPMRQAWINNLRKKVSALIATADCLYHGGLEVTDRYADLRKIKRLEEEIILTVNPAEEEHQALLKQIRTMIVALESNGKEQEFLLAEDKTRRLTQTILKTEWDRVRGWRSLRKLWKRMKDIQEQSNL